MFHLSFGLAYFYLLRRFVSPLAISRVWRLFIGGVLLAISQYHLIQIWTFGTMFSPEMPHWAVVAAGWAFGTFFLLFVLVSLTDFIGWLVLGFRRHGDIRQAKSRRSCALAQAAMLLSFVGVQQAMEVPEVRKLEVSIANLPTALEGLRVVQLTDLHISRLLQADWVAEVVERSNRLKPDLVVVTGDLIDGTIEARERDIAPLGRLRAKFGVIVIPGNHEYYFNEPMWRAVFERLGMRALLNGHVVIGNDNEPLVIAGVNDEAAPQFQLDGPDLEEALLNAPPNAPVVLLKHRPEGAEQSAKAGVALQLSGHTHGGMILGFDRLVAYANEGYVSGSYSVGDMTLYTSRGAGLWNGFPIRLGVPSEITEFTLRRPLPSPFKGDSL